MDTEVGIALWGPKGSGKTSLIYAFGETINRTYSKGIQGLDYLLKDINSGLIDVKPPSQIKEVRDGTTEPTGYNWQFSRVRSKEEKNHGFSARAYEVSTHSHWIAFFDDRGQKLVDILDSTGPDIDRALLRILRAPNIMILLDLTLLEEGEYKDPTEQRVRFTQNQYKTMVANLFTQMSKHADENQYRGRRIAVCLTKSDWLERGRVDRAMRFPENAWELIEEEFGGQMTSVLERNSREYEIRPFVVSAKHVGDDHWNPNGIEWPFFWLFEATEIDLINEKNVKSGWRRLGQFLFGDQRNDNYIPYPKIKWG